ncbi:MAG: sensor histidine kinase [Ginsengibacter sp.]
MTQLVYLCRQSLSGKLLRHLSIAILFFISSSKVIGQSHVFANKGVLNLREWNWQTDGVPSLNGEWEFYWHQLVNPNIQDSSVDLQRSYIMVPGFWNSNVPGSGFFKPAFGYATYHLKVLCPAGSGGLDLKLLTIASAYKLFVNGKQLLQIGKVVTSKDEAIPDYKPAIIHVEPVDDVLDIVIHVSNFNYSTGGLWDYIKLGPHDQIQSLWITDIGIDFFLAGSFFLVGIYFMIIFFYFKNRPASLYFSFFCLIVAVRPLVTDELGILYVTNWNWQLVKHIEFISLYLSVPILSLLSYELFPREFPKKILNAILLISLPFLLAAVFAPPYIFRYGLKPFQLFMLLSAVFGLYVYINAARNKRPGSVYFLTGFIILFITIINDILYNSLIINSANLIYIGIFIFIMSQAIAISRQFFRAFEKMELLNTELEIINVELNQKNVEINEANEQLTRLNSELDILVSRTSHDLRSPITSVAALVHIIKMEPREAKRFEYLDMQLNTLHRLNLLITDILDFSRNKRTKLNFEPADFSEILNNVFRDHQFADNATHIERIADVKQDTIFITDKSRVNMILNNLISNALKYYDRQKDDPYVKIIINAESSGARIIVTDNGTGIGKDDLKNVFTMYYQANENFKGAGLGLYIVHEAIEKLGGTIDISSELLEGTTFTIFIPNGMNIQPVDPS